MPTVEEIEDESYRRFANEKAGVANDDDEWDDEDSQLSDDVSDEEEVTERGLSRIGDETLFERITALRDIISPTTRQAIVQRLSQAQSYGTTAFIWGGRAAWFLTTTALLIGLPYALASEDEARIVQQEREMAGQSQGAQQMFGQRGDAGQQQQLGGASGGQQQAQGIRPPGF